MVSIFYGSTFLHRSQLLYIINRASSVHSRHPIPTHPPIHPPPSIHRVLFFSLAARRESNLRRRVKWISIESRDSPRGRPIPTHNREGRGGEGEGERERERETSASIETGNNRRWLLLWNLIRPASLRMHKLSQRPWEVPLAFESTLESIIN